MQISFHPFSFSTSFAVDLCRLGRAINYEEICFFDVNAFIRLLLLLDPLSPEEDFKVFKEICNT